MFVIVGAGSGVFYSLHAYGVDHFLLVVTCHILQCR